ncbi:MAG: alginate export family protein [Stenotrophobium sp.]
MNVSSLLRTTIAQSLALAALACTTSALADSLSTLPDALSGGKASLDARLRYENVDQHNIATDANAVTARARLGFTTKTWNGFTAELEYQGVAAVGNDNYNSTHNGRTQYPVVPDPSGSEANQAWIAYSGLPGTVIKYGRQRIVYDNARFVGDVGFRQNQQTYDGLTLTGTWLPKLTFNYAYLTNIDSFKYSTINGVSTQNIGLNNTQLFNLNYASQNWLKFTGYAYLVNFAYDPPIPPLNNANRDTATYGGRATGAVPLVPVTLNYAVEYAHQNSYGDSPSAVQANYYLAEFGASYSHVFGTLGYEVLGGNGNYAFQTPLATLHAFQGWADQFLTTPAAGVDDLYVTVGGKLEQVKLTAIWHDFNSNDSSAGRYGSEIDLLASRPIGKLLTVTAAYAYYSADHYPVAAGTPFDTSKAWLWFDLKI